MNYRKTTILLLLILLAFKVKAQKPSQYNLKVGDQFKVTTAVKQDIQQTMFGQEVNTKQSINTIDIYEVVTVTSDRYKLRTTGLSRSMTTESPQGSNSVDSDLSGDDHLAFRTLTSKSYYVTMNKYGKYLSFEGFDKMREAVTEELKGTALEGSEDDLLSAYNEETLGSAFDGMFYIYQEPGKPWERSTDMIVNNLPIAVSYDFSWIDNSSIEAKGVMEMKGDFEAMGLVMTADMAGNQTTIYKLDQASGLATSLKTMQELGGSLQAEDFTIPMTLKTEVTVTVVK